MEPLNLFFSRLLLRQTYRASLRMAALSCLMEDTLNNSEPSSHFSTYPPNKICHSNFKGKKRGKIKFHNDWMISHRVMKSFRKSIYRIVNLLSSIKQDRVGNGTAKMIQFSNLRWIKWLIVSKCDTLWAPLRWF